MFTTEEIFARLMNGESMDSIAAEMTEDLNAAKEKKEAADKRKAEEEAKAKREAVINEAAEKAADAVNELIRIMYPEMADATEQLTAAMLKDMVESSYVLVKEVEKAFPMFEKINACGLSRAEAAKQIEDGIKAVEAELVSAPKVGDATKCSEKKGCSCAGKRSKVATLDELCEEAADDILKSFCNGFKF
jgi:DNA-binding TFAR19-related protein (PDSD5 family)